MSRDDSADEDDHVVMCVVPMCGMSSTLKLGSGANSRSALVRLVDADGTVVLTLGLDTMSAHSSDGCRRIAASVGPGDVVVATAESLTVGDGVWCAGSGNDVSNDGNDDVVKLMMVSPQSSDGLLRISSIDGRVDDARGVVSTSPSELINGCV